MPRKEAIIIAMLNANFSAGTKPGSVMKPMLYYLLFLTASGDDGDNRGDTNSYASCHSRTYAGTVSCGVYNGMVKNRHIIEQ